MAFNPKHKTKTFKIPLLQCLQRDVLSPLSFREWVRGNNNVYIGQNLNKYMDSEEYSDVWSVKSLEDKLRNGEITHDEYLYMYEEYIRTVKWENLPDLDSKVLGCWCRNTSLCHGRVLQRLFKEQLLERRMTTKDDENADIFNFNSSNLFVDSTTV